MQGRNNRSYANVRLAALKQLIIPRRRQHTVTVEIQKRGLMD